MSSNGHDTVGATELADERDRAGGDGQTPQPKDAAEVGGSDDVGDGRVIFESIIEYLEKKM